MWHAADLDGDAVPEIAVGTGGAAPQLALLSAKGDVLWRVGLSSPVGAIVGQDLDGDGTLELVVGLASGQIGVYDEPGEGCAPRPTPACRCGGWRRRRTAPYWCWQMSLPGDWPAKMASVADRGCRRQRWSKPSRDLCPRVRSQTTVRRSLCSWEMFRRDARWRTSWPATARPFPGTDCVHSWRRPTCGCATWKGYLRPREKPLDKSYLVRAHPTWGQTLSAGGLDLVTLANNHALDYGPAGPG